MRLESTSSYMPTQVKHEPSSPSLNTSHRNSPANTGFEVSDHAQIATSSAYTSDNTTFDAQQENANYCLSSDQNQQQILATTALTTASVITSSSSSAINASIVPADYSISPHIRSPEYDHGLPENLTAQLSVNGTQMLTPHIVGPTCGAKDLTIASEQR
mgnify:CR=1 FL=1